MRHWEEIERSLKEIGFNRVYPPDAPIEQIIGEADLSPGSINAGLISLRLKGLIRQLPGNLFLRG